jgi:hypothetical protein
MKFINFDTIYANGSSLTAGGGLSDYGVKQEYKKQHGVEWDNEKNVTYPKYIADHFGVNLVHDAFSGSGAPRLVRRTYEYIQEVGIDKARKTLFLFEITDPPHRVDLYVEKVNDYVITNVRYDDDRNIGSISSIQMQDVLTKDGIKYNHDYFKEQITEEVKDYLGKYHNPMVYFNKFVGELVGLFSFLEENNIEYFYWFDNDSLQMPFKEFYVDYDKRRNLKFGGFNCVNQFCTFQNMRICDELNGASGDMHPGYFGNKNFAEKVIKMLEGKLKPTLYVFGDSHTQTFANHYKSDLSWAKQYINHLGETPKNYPDLIAEHYNIEVVNYGMGGCSNYTIFESFINNHIKIKPKDIVIFGWTSISRFRVADNVNNFVDIIPFTPHPKQNDDVSKVSTEQIGYNKETHSVWWSEIEGFIKIINHILKKNKVLHWTWVKPDVILPTRIWSQESIDLKHSYIFNNWGESEPELQELMRKNCDHLVDLTKDVNLNEMKNLAENDKRIIFINIELCSEETRQFIYHNFNLKHYQSRNFKKDCYKHFIPYKKYQSIIEETNGAVDDLHIGRFGHIELFKDLIRELENKKPVV